MLWRDPHNEYSRKLVDRVWENRVVSYEDLVTTTRLVRSRKLFVETSVRLTFESLIKDCRFFTTFLVRRPEDHDTLFGTHVETLGRTAAKCTTWQGVCIDQELLERGLREIPDLDPEEHRYKQTLLAHYQGVRNFLRLDGCIRPAYRRQGTFRLGSVYPNTQNFTTIGGYLGSKNLVVPPEGEILAGFDIRMAELFALGKRWMEHYPDDPRSPNLLNWLNEGRDLHYDSGRVILNGARLGREDIRRLGKIGNFSLLNLAPRTRLDENLQAQNLPGITEEKFEKFAEYFQENFPVDRWKEQAKRSRYPVTLKTHYGRLMRVDRPSQWTGYQFQTITGDATAIGAFNLVRYGYHPRLLVHDEVVLSFPTVKELRAAEVKYIDGFRMILPEARPRTRIRVYPERWGEENLDVLAVR